MNGKDDAEELRRLVELVKTKSQTFEVGDVVYHEEEPATLGIVTRVAMRGVTVVWSNGGSEGGPGLVPGLHHREPRVRLPVPNGALGYRGWNREQAVTAALRRAGLIEGGKKA